MKMSIQEKKYVINLHKRGYIVLQIAQVHMSSTDVIEDLKEYIGEDKFFKKYYLFI
jgi:hypothetical protein